MTIKVPSKPIPVGGGEGGGGQSSVEWGGQMIVHVYFAHLGCIQNVVGGALEFFLGQVLC